MLERLWAPWRYDYVSAPGERAKGCIFCAIASEDQTKDAENHVIHRGENVYAVLNRYPYINGHMMIVPFRHVPDLSALTPDETREMMEMLVVAERALRDGMNCQGMNGGWNIGSAGGAGIPGHLHMHVLPRWNGDTNFMSTVSGIRVVSQSLERAMEVLMPFFREEFR